MTDEQKRAMTLLNRVREKMTEDEYFMLMEFIVKEPMTKIEYVPVLIATHNVGSKSRRITPSHG